MRFLLKSEEKMRKALIISMYVTLMAVGVLCADEPLAVTHTEFQAVDETGEQTFVASDVVILEGIVLNNPADMLDPTPDDTNTTLYDMAGQWQIYVQGQGDDHAGTAVWMGQLYDNLPWVMPGRGYTNQEWIAELTRLNAAQFAPGDRIRVTGHFLSYKGKNNINEQHSNDPAQDFTIELIEKGLSVPKPEVVTLDDLKDDQDGFIFDPARLAGGEYYQSRLIKIEDVNVVDANNWAPDGEMNLTDGVRTLPLKLGRGTGIYAGSFNLTELFDVIGILDHESTNLTGGYRLYVMNYDGNGQVLAAPEHRLADLIDLTDPNDIVDPNEAG